VPDLSVAPYRNGNLVMKDSFDVGAGPSFGLDRVWQTLADHAEDGEVDDVSVRSVSFMEDWEDIVSGKRDGWRVESEDEESGTTTVVCAPAELARIRAAMTVLRPHVPAPNQAQWDKLTAFYAACSESGATICLWYDPMG
jgi:hypothetical protein